MSSDAGPAATPAPVAYLVLAHRRPEQVVRLARRILALSPHARVFVHWDSKTRERLDSADLPDGAEVVSTRVRARWGTWSLVEATLVLLRAARAACRPRWYVLISGEDWPVRDLAAWEATLDAAGVDAVVQADPVQDRWALGDAAVPLAEDEARRYGDRWHVLPPSGVRPLDRALAGVARRIEARVRPRGYPAVLSFYTRGVAVAFRPGPGLPAGWRPYKGEQWVTLSDRAARAVLGAPAGLTAHYRRTLIPDESYVQTILLNHADLRVLRGRTSYAPWAHFGREPNLVLRPEDLPDVAASAAPFARKVGEGAFAAITAHLDSAVGAATTGGRPGGD